MKKIILTLLVVVACTIVMVNCKNKDTQSNNGGKTTLIKCDPPSSSYAPFPSSGFDYPLDKSVIDRWVTNQQMDSIRMHAWYLWAGINQKAPNGKLVWQTWYPVSTTMEIEPGGGSVSALKNFRMGNHNNLTTMPGDTSFCSGGGPQYPPSNDTDYGFLANNGDIMIAGEYFNYEAYCHIRSNMLYKASKLNSYLKDKNKAPGGEIPQFPKGSIILKHMYWPVKQDGFSALPVWDGQATCSDPQFQYNGYETWKRLVAIDPTNSSKLPYMLVNYLHLPGYHSITRIAKVVPMSDFYSWQIDSATWNSLALNDKRIIDSSFMWAYGRHFKPGDYLVSIAMHIITKEIYNWAMQSFWWHDIDTGYYASDKPAGLAPGTWQHYLVTTAYSMVTPTLADGSPHVAYNPYIELVVPEKNRIMSNCQNCHARAGYPSSPTIFDPLGQDPVITGPDSARYNAMQRGLIQPTDSIFTGIVTTDFSWVLTDRAH